MAYDFLEENGWTVTKRGWPDLFCFNENGEICCVEVKPHCTSQLKTNQVKIMQELSKYGVPCFKWTPEAGLERI